MACPHVAGAAALFIAENPGSTVQTVKDALESNSAIEMPLSLASFSYSFNLFGDMDDDGYYYDDDNYDDDLFDASYSYSFSFDLNDLLAYCPIPDWEFENPLPGNLGNLSSPYNGGAVSPSSHDSSMEDVVREYCTPKILLQATPEFLLAANAGNRAEQIDQVLWDIDCPGASNPSQSRRTQEQHGSKMPTISSMKTKPANEGPATSDCSYFYYDALSAAFEMDYYTQCSNCTNEGTAGAKLYLHLHDQYGDGWNGAGWTWYKKTESTSGTAFRDMGSMSTSDPLPWCASYEDMPPTFPPGGRHRYDPFAGELFFFLGEPGWDDAITIAPFTRQVQELCVDSLDDGCYILETQTGIWPEESGWGISVSNAHATESSISDCFLATGLPSNSVEICLGDHDVAGMQIGCSAATSTATPTSSPTISSFTTSSPTTSSPTTSSPTTSSPTTSPLECELDEDCPGEGTCACEAVRRKLLFGNFPDNPTRCYCTV